MFSLQEIQPYVTHFSEQIRQQCKHMDQVKIAGEIKQVFQLPNLEEPHLDLGDDELPVKTFSSFYVLKVDDLVGEINVYVSPFMWNYFDFLKEGNVVVFEGYVNTLNRTIQNKSIRDVNIVAFDARLLKEGATAV